MNKTAGALLLLLALSFAGCGGAKGVSLPDAKLKAIDYNVRAEAAYQKGDYQRALALYSEALRVNRSIEDTDGVAMDLIGMAAVYRKTGSSLKAGGLLDEVLGDPSSKDVYLSEAAFLKALTQIDLRNNGSALEWAEKSLSYCKSAGCPSEGKIHNLMARTMLLENDPKTAIDQASQAVKLNKDAGDRVEEANSIRLMAEGNYLVGQYPEALRLYGEALSMDKALGLSRKIFLDLMGAGDTLLKQGNSRDAADYYERALEVARGAGDEEAGSEASGMISKLRDAR